MADPFVQKMMARSQARRAAVGKSQTDKENARISTPTRTKLKNLSNLYTDGPKDEQDPQKIDLEPQSVKPPSPKKVLTENTITDRHPETTTTATTSTATSAGFSSTSTGDLEATNRSRLGRLAKRCQEMRNWEDDYTYHSTSHGGLQQKVVLGGTLASEVHDKSSTVASNSGSISSTVHFSNLSDSNAVKTSSSSNSNAIKTSSSSNSNAVKTSNSSSDSVNAYDSTSSNSVNATNSNFSSIELSSNPRSSVLKNSASNPSSKNNTIKTTDLSNSNAINASNSGTFDTISTSISMHEKSSTVASNSGSISIPVKTSYCSSVTPSKTDHYITSTSNTPGTVFPQIKSSTSISISDNCTVFKTSTSFISKKGSDSSAISSIKASDSSSIASFPTQDSNPDPATNSSTKFSSDSNSGANKANSSNSGANSFSKFSSDTKSGIASFPNSNSGSDKAFTSDSNSSGINSSTSSPPKYYFGQERDSNNSSNNSESFSSINITSSLPSSSSQSPYMIPPVPKNSGVRDSSYSGSALSLSSVRSSVPNDSGSALSLSSSCTPKIDSMHGSESSAFSSGSALSLSSVHSSVTNDSGSALSLSSPHPPIINPMHGRTIGGKSSESSAFSCGSALSSSSPPRSSKKIKSHSTPTKKLDWDRGMINSLMLVNDGMQEALEAQGFTPSDSRSKLYYDYKQQERNSPVKPTNSATPAPAPAATPGVRSSPQKPELPSPSSPSKVRSLAEFMRSESPQKIDGSVSSISSYSPGKLRKFESSNPASPDKTRDASVASIASYSPMKQRNYETTNTPASNSASIASYSPGKQRKPEPFVNNSASTCMPKLPQATAAMYPSPPKAPPLPPVIVSCTPKSPQSSPSRKLSRMPSAEPVVVKDRSRDQSPSKVREMRSRWEQHIRQASPERTDRSRSPRKTNAESPVRRNVPQKQQGGRSSASDIQYQEQAGFRQASPERKNWREQSPEKSSGPKEIIRSSSVPDVEPVVTQPFMSSVRERAAAFDIGGRKPVKDPAEMTVQERLAIFNKKKSNALVPKAPFGQPVPTRVLQGDGSSCSESNVPTMAKSQPVHKPLMQHASAPQERVYYDETSNKETVRQNQETVAQKQVFENVVDNWRENEINSKIQSERQKEMEVLMNRFKKPKQVDARNSVALPSQTNSSAERPPKYPEESESDYLESDESIGGSTTSEDALQDGISGPPKPPRLFLDSPTPTPTHPPLLRGSPSGRLNSTEIGEVRPSPRKSPKKEFVPKVKPGCLFPSLSDIESHSEAPDSQDEDDIKDSSFAESVLTCASMESLGQKIQKSAQASARPLSMIEEGTASRSASYSAMNVSMSESTMEALEAIDDAIDEALCDDPTPPKRARVPDDDRGVYKTPKSGGSNSSTHPGFQTDTDVSLAHSISLYRKQKPDVTYTPVRQMICRPDLRSPTPEPVSPSVNVSARIKVLHEEVLEQQRVIAQASNAITVVLERPEQQGTPQHVEAEKLLLLSSQKRQTALNEIQRLKAEGALGQQHWNNDEETCMGSISISNISVPLKHDFLQRGIKGEDTYHLLVLVKHREQVISSQLLQTPQCVVEGAVTFPNLMSLHHLTSDFNITLEVYALCTHKPRNSNIKKEHSRMRLTPLKRLHKHDSRMSPSVQSPGGPFAVRTSDFQLVGFTHLNISTLTRNAWTLEKVPFSSPLDGHLLMNVSCSFEGGINERGFLTMFEDVGGYGAWNRRWCVLNGMHLRYWRYPDDETRKEPTGELDLRSCTTRRVELVSRDVCARQHTFNLTIVKPAQPRDVTNLVQEVKGPSLVIRMLMSADSKEERILWCNKLNKALANIRAWDPDALGPEDFQV